MLQAQEQLDLFLADIEANAGDPTYVPAESTMPTGQSTDPTPETARAYITRKKTSLKRRILTCVVKERRELLKRRRQEFFSQQHATGHPTAATAPVDAQSDDMSPLEAELGEGIPKCLAFGERIESIEQIESMLDYFEDPGAWRRQQTPQRTTVPRPRATRHETNATRTPNPTRRTGQTTTTLPTGQTTTPQLTGQTTTALPTGQTTTPQLTGSTTTTLPTGQTTATPPTGQGTTTQLTGQANPTDTAAPIGTNQPSGRANPTVTPTITTTSPTGQVPITTQPTGQNNPTHTATTVTIDPSIIQERPDSETDDEGDLTAIAELLGAVEDMYDHMDDESDLDDDEEEDAEDEYLDQEAYDADDMELPDLDFDDTSTRSSRSPFTPRLHTPQLEEVEGAPTSQNEDLHGPTALNRRKKARFDKASKR